MGQRVVQGDKAHAVHHGKIRLYIRIAIRASKSRVAPRPRNSACAARATRFKGSRVLSQGRMLSLRPHAPLPAQTTCGLTTLPTASSQELLASRPSKARLDLHPSSSPRPPRHRPALTAFAQSHNAITVMQATRHAMVASQTIVCMRHISQQRSTSS